MGQATAGAPAACGHCGSGDGVRRYAYRKKNVRFPDELATSESRERVSICADCFPKLVDGMALRPVAD